MGTLSHAQDGANVSGLVANRRIGCSLLSDRPEVRDLRHSLSLRGTGARCGRADFGWHARAAGYKILVNVQRHFPIMLKTRLLGGKYTPTGALPQEGNASKDAVGWNEGAHSGIESRPAPARDESFRLRHGY